MVRDVYIRQSRSENDVITTLFLIILIIDYHILCRHESEVNIKFLSKTEKIVLESNV